MLRFALFSSELVDGEKQSSCDDELVSFSSLSRELLLDSSLLQQKQFRGLNV